MKEVRYTLTRKDLWHYQLYVFRHGIWVVLFIQLYLIVILLFYSFSMGIFFSLFLISMPLACGLMSLFFQLRRSVSKGIQVIKKRGVEIITISEQSIAYKNDLSCGTASWRTLQAIREDRHNLYLIRDGTGLNAVPIPRRAFASPQEATSFLEQAREYWHKQSSQSATNET